MNIDTEAIHAGASHDQYGSVTEPVYRASTFAFRNIAESDERGRKIFSGEGGAYIYTRLGNPTNAALERRIAALEQAEDCVVTASGIGAVSTVMWTFLKAGDHVLADTALYGDTHGLMEHVLTKFGVEVTFVDFGNHGLVRNSLRPATAIVYFESPCNPTLKVNDIADIARLVHDINRDIRIVIDNTFATPYLQNPLTLGADIVVHSMTKYMGGHSDVLGGCILGSRADMTQVRTTGIEMATGAVAAPDNAFLVLRGLATLPVRMARHCENAAKIADYLAASPFVAKVHYPGLASLSGHEVARKQMRLFGGMISFELNATFAQTKEFVDRLNLVRLAVSLGGVESLLEHPASMTHAHFTPEELAAADITPSQVRLSVGIENVEDIIADLEQALQAALG